MAVLWALAMLPLESKRHGRLLSNVQPEKRRDVSCWPIPAVAGIYTARQLSGDGRKGKLERAIDDYNQAIQLNPNYSWAYYRRAQAYSNRREFARAIRDYDETIRKPALVDNQQGGAAVEPAFDTVEQIGQHRGPGTGADQSFGLEGLDGGLAEPFGLGVEQPAPGSADAIGLQCALQRTGLEQDRQPGQRALANRGAGERGERRPHELLHLRRDGHALAGQDRGHPFGGPRPLAGVFDTGEWLERNGIGDILGNCTASILPVAPHGERAPPARPPPNP